MQLHALVHWICEGPGVGITMIAAVARVGNLSGTQNVTDNRKKENHAEHHCQRRVRLRRLGVGVLGFDDSAAGRAQARGRNSVFTPTRGCGNFATGVAHDWAGGLDHAL